MTEEEIKALQEESEANKKAAEEAKASIAALQAQAEKSKQDLDGVVKELQEERLKKQEALDKAKITNGDVDIATAIQEALDRRDKESAKAIFEEALNEFKGKKTEFQSDTSGMVFGKFKEQLNKYNLSDLTTKDEISGRLEEIYKFTNFQASNGTTTEYEGTDHIPSSVPEHQTPESLSTKKVLEESGVSEDKFKSIKEKYPEVIERLGL